MAQLYDFKGLIFLSKWKNYFSCSFIQFYGSNRLIIIQTVVQRDEIKTGHNKSKNQTNKFV